MNSEMQRRLEVMRRELDESEHGLEAGSIPPGSTPSDVDAIDARWQAYRSFLLVCNGGTFGSVDIWGSHEVMAKQFLALDLPGGSERWLVVGQVLYETVACDENGRLRLFVRDGSPEGQDLDTFDEFLLRILGPGYVDVVVDGHEDPWWDSLLSAGLRPARSD